MSSACLAIECLFLLTAIGTSDHMTRGHPTSVHAAYRYPVSMVIQVSPLEAEMYQKKKDLANFMLVNPACVQCVLSLCCHDDDDIKV